MIINYKLYNGKYLIKALATDGITKIALPSLAGYFSAGIKAIPVYIAADSIGQAYKKIILIEQDRNNDEVLLKDTIETIKNR